MCGIAGYISNGRSVNQSVLQQMAEILHHRGPDDCGMYCQEKVGMVHTRLSIIDLKGGHQPLLAQDETLALVANGEIYNYISLTADLKRQGCQFLSKSDSETILHAYVVYGRDFLSHLSGMFAFALYDKVQEKVILARDRLGIKPLYYVELPGRVAFASEIKALLPLLQEPGELDKNAFIAFLENEFSAGNRTIIRGVHRVLPGEVIEINEKLQIERRRYWSALDVQPLKIGFDDASSIFDKLMDQVISEHLHADVPFGLFLSGGVDSGLLAALMSRHQGKPIRSFSVGYQGTKYTGEIRDAERIAKMFDAHHTVLELSKKNILSRIPHMIWSTDELMLDYACLPTSILAEQASNEVKMVVTGEGGDEVFAGYGRYRKPRLQRILKSMIAPGSGGFRTRGQWHKRYVRNTLGHELRHERHSVRAPFITAWQETPTNWSDIQRGQYTDLKTALPDNLLVKVDRMLMGFALEGRVPYLDHRIVEFGLSLPDQFKTMPGQGKLFLKRWAEQYLPKDHLYRKKRGFGVPIGEWLHGSFLESIGCKLINNPAINKWFDRQGVRRLIDDQQKNRSATHEIMSLVHFGIWHRLFIEQPGVRPTTEEDLLDWIT
jgi:asparagine synthase (glutamine-hydrolysing)